LKSGHRPEEFDWRFMAETGSEDSSLHSGRLIFYVLAYVRYRVGPWIGNFNGQKGT